MSGMLGAFPQAPRAAHHCVQPSGGDATAQLPRAWVLGGVGTGVGWGDLPSLQWNGSFVFVQSPQVWKLSHCSKD